MILAISAVSTLLLLVVLYNRFTKTFDYWKLRNVPGPKPVAFFGNIKKSALRKENSAETLANIYRLFPDEPVIGIYRMTTPCLLLRDLDVIKHVMIKDFATFDDRGIRFSDEGLGVNLFHADGETWRTLRSKYLPMFTSRKLKDMSHLILQHGNNIIAHIERMTANQTELEIYDEILKYSISTSASCIFGLEIDTTASPLIKYVNKIDKLIFRTHFLFELDMMYPGLLKRLNYSLFPKEIQHFFLDTVLNVINSRNGRASERRDFMDLCIELMHTSNDTFKLEDVNNKPDKEIKLQVNANTIAAQTFVFFAAGYENSGTTIAFMLYELAKNYNVQKTLLEEIDYILQEHNEQITYDMLNKLIYLEMVIKETLRKYPIVPIQRKANADYNIPGTNITIEKGCIVLISVMGIHYDEKYYPDPETFDPERFSPENSKNHHSCAYMPFGVGPRNCIGTRLGKLQTQIFVVKLLSKFRVEPSPKTQKVVFHRKRLIIDPYGGIYLNLIPRN